MRSKECDVLLLAPAPASLLALVTQLMPLPDWLHAETIGKLPQHVMTKEHMRRGSSVSLSTC